MTQNIQTPTPLPGDVSHAESPVVQPAPSAIAPSSENNIRLNPPEWQFRGGNPGTFADNSAVVKGRVLNPSKVYNGGLSPEYAAFIGKSPATSTGIHAAMASNTVEGPASIVELARALQNDPQLIFEYVYNNIDWQPGWGVTKGAMGALLDGTANAFDQCMLLVALLRQAGFTANYVLGQIQMPVADYDSWFGTDSSSNSYCCYWYAQWANIPGSAPTWNGSAWIMTMSHVWVQVTVSGTTYVLDPSIKAYTTKAPVANLASILGYNQATFLADAESGATIDGSGNFVQNMNTKNIAADLTTMTSNLLTYIKNNAVGSAPAGTATVDDVLGGKAINPVTLPFTWQTSLSYELSGDTPTIWTGDVPLAYKTTLQVQYLQQGDGSFPIDQTFTSDQLAGGRLTLTFDGSLHPVLTLNGSVVQTSSIAQGAGTWNSAQLTVVHNAYTYQPTPWPWWQQFIYAGQYYLIGNTWGVVGRGQADFHRNQLAAVLANGASTDEAIKGEYMSTIWWNWATQASRVADLAGRLNKTNANFFHQIGIVGLYYSGGVPTPSTDIRGVAGFAATLNYDFNQPSITNTVSSMHGVALEAATLAQFNGVNPGVSTTTVIDKANRTAVVKLGGTVTVGNVLTLTVNDAALSGGTKSDSYTVVGGDTLSTIATALANAINADTSLQAIGVTALANGTVVLLSSTSANQTTYTSSTSGGATETITIAWSKIYLANSSNWTAGINIKNILTTNGVDAGMIAAMDGYITGSPTAPVMTPDQPIYVLGAWTGEGFWALPVYGTTNNGGAYGIIANVAKGGGGQPADPTSIPLSAISGNYQSGQQTSSDPIGLFTGDFFYNRSDISVGSQSFPFGLSFGRSYSSANQYQNGVLGWGWTHNHNITATMNSDGLLAMGDQFAAQGAATIAELFVTMDLGADSTQPIAKVVTMSLADKWWVDRLVNNTVAVSLPTGAGVFVKQPDGSYTAPSNMPSTLTLVGGLYTLTTPQGIKFNFNSSGQLSTWVSPAGMTVTYTYSGGQLSTISNGLGRTLTLNYTSGKLTSVTDGNGRSVSYAYDGSGNLQTFSDTQSNSITHQYDQPGRMTAVLLPLNPGTAVVTNVYDSLSRVKTQANARNQVWNYYFAGSRSQENDALGNASVRYFNRLGSVTRFINALGFETDTQYDGLNRPIKTTLPEGNGAQATYDSNNHLLTMTSFAKPGSGLSNISASNTFDPTWAKVKTSTDANGNITTFNYDAVTGNLISVTRPTIGGLTPKVTMKYNSRGQLLTATDDTGIQSQLIYDASTEKLLSSIGNTNWLCTVGGTVTVGNVLTITAHDSGLAGGVRSVSYTVVGGDTLAKIATGLANAVNADTTLGALGIIAYVNGAVVSLSTSPGNTTTFTGSTSGGATETLTFTAGLNISASFGYDSVGNATSITDPNLNQATAIYDSERRPTQATGPAPFNYVSKIAYNVNGRVTSVQQQVSSAPSFITATVSYTLTDKVQTTNDPVGRQTSWSYDGLDRVQSVTDAQGRTYQYAYDALSRLSTVTDPSNTISDTETYTNNGKSKTTKDAAGNITQYAYDGFDRPVKTTFADTTTAQITSFDNNGNVLTALTRSGNSVTFTYDVLNRMSTKAPTGQATVTYTYDLASRLLTVSKPTVGGDPSTGIFSVAYDSAGRFYQEQYPDGKTVTHVLDNNGNRTKTTWPDGYYVTRSFDQLNRLTNVYLNGSGTPSLTYNFDQLSRRTSVSMGNGTSTFYSLTLDGDLTSLTNVFVGSSNQYTFAYNNAHQITGFSVTDSSYLWSPSSAGTVSYGAADSVNKYPTVGGVSFTYDGNKNLTYDGTWTYTYNTENQLLSAVSGGNTNSYVYDPTGRQAQKTVSGTATRFIYDGLNLIATYDGSGNLINRYIHGPGADEPAIQVTAGGTVSYFHRDFQGSIVALSNSSGAVTNKYTYGPFGESAALSGTIFGYTGQRYDAETGLYYYKARYYSTKIGRFLQTDPIGYAAGDLNIYSYVGNDPVNSRDPLGLYRIPFRSSGAYWSDVAIWGPGIANAYWYHDFSGFADAAYLGIAGMTPASAGGTNSGAASGGGNKGGAGGSDGSIESLYLRSGGGFSLETTGIYSFDVGSSNIFETKESLSRTDYANFIFYPGLITNAVAEYIGFPQTILKQLLRLGLAQALDPLQLERTQSYKLSKSDSAILDSVGPVSGDVMSAMGWYYPRTETTYGITLMSHAVIDPNVGTIKVGYDFSFSPLDLQNARTYGSIIMAVNSDGNIVIYNGTLPHVGFIYLRSSNYLSGYTFHI